MLVRAVSIVALVLAAVAVAAPAGGQSSAGAGVGSQSLDGWMSDRGYTKVPLVQLPTGHFSVGGTADAIPLFLIVDTGSSHTVIDTERAERFGLTTEDRGEQATGVGLSTQNVQSGLLEDVEIGAVRVGSVRVSVLDLSQVNRVLRGMGNAPVDGIIGADVLMAGEAVIDYGTLTMYFKE